MKRLAWIMAWLAVAAAAPGENAITLADISAWKIICAPPASPSEHYAAAEFQRLFREMTGTILPILEAAPADAGVVCIGSTAVSRQGEPVLVRELYGEEGFRLEVRPHSLYIDGAGARGTLYGVYEFFEEWCGVRFLTFDHTYYPDRPRERKIPLGRHGIRKPVFAFRWSYYGENARHPEFATRLRVNTLTDDPQLGGRTGWRLVSHNVASLVPPAKWGKEHPEYFALVDGQRRLEMGGGGPQLCMSHPGLVEVVVQAVLAEIAKDPRARNISIAQMDNESYCTCPACAALDAREESHAAATLSFVNAVAERIEPMHPDIVLSTYAYLYTRKPPKTLRARHNVMIQLCSIECCDFHAIDDRTCALNRSFCEDLAGWKQKAERIFIWHYNTNFKGYTLPFPNLRSLGRSVAYFAENHGRGVFMQAAGNGFSTELSDLRNYVMARCLWRPGRDSWQEATEFCRLHYAESAEPILACLKDYHDRVGAARVHPTCFPTEAALALNLESAARIMAYFDAALARAQSEIIRARVAKASVCALRAALSAASMELVISNGICRPNLAGFPSDLLARYAALCRRFEVTMEDELTTTAQYLAGWRSLHAGLQAVRLENEFWRVVVLPESNAKVVEMTYKPTGRNVTYARRSFGRFRHEEWLRQGEGPSASNILPFTVQAEPHDARFTLTTKDGARLERRITLQGEAIRFTTVATAGKARTFDFQIHPEYDTATGTDDPEVLAIYVRQPGWQQVNRHWRHAEPTSEQRAVVHQAVQGGAYAYFNHQAGFGVEQRFAPGDFARLGVFWEPSRQQINLELFSPIVSLQPGEQMRYAYEVRHLQRPP
ncbi:MAG TPA: DUF4838 domain-containing protein [Verrucomicrobiota bacterium]|nr:DUF4838 domain-containing protein [Verrucomicrobiota bacterium]HNT14370.1 DUF4838 domain-containing protein [Verrucomicrobiota bacterium]